MKIGRVTLNGDKYGPEIEEVITKIFDEPSQFVRVAAPNDPKRLRAEMIRLCDDEKCTLVFTFGGTGPSEGDFFPEATLDIADKQLPGFGELMRYYSFERGPTAALSRATGAVRGRSMIINLPTRPKAVKFCLRLLREAIAEGLGLITGVEPVLYVDPIVVPLEKYFPFLKWLKPKSDPRGEKHPSLPI